MAAAIATHPPLAKKPSIKKYRAPTPPKQLENCDKDKENNLLQREENENDDATDTCVQTNEAEGKAPEKGSPVVKRIAPKLNGNVDRNSVLSRAAIFEAGSPRAKEKDPAEMSLRERKALFEKNKGAAIIPKAPFGLAPSAKALHGETKGKPVYFLLTPTLNETRVQNYEAAIATRCLEDSNLNSSHSNSAAVRLPQKAITLVIHSREVLL